MDLANGDGKPLLNIFSSIKYLGKHRTNRGRSLLKNLPNMLVQKTLDLIKLYINNPEDKQYIHWAFTYANRLSKFHNLHIGEDCFIIGNGPSLNKMDLTPLKNHHTFGLNKIYLMFNKVDLNLSYHVSVNPLVIEQSAAEFEKLFCPSFLSFRAANHIIRPLDHIYFIFTSAGPYLFQDNAILRMHEGYTVTYVALQLAYFMGFKRVFLIGVDHNFSASGKPNEKQLYAGSDQNHFDPHYFENQQWQLPDLEASELFYRIAKFFFTRNGRQLFDATVDGKLQIFPKISYDQALLMCSKKN